MLGLYKFDVDQHVSETSAHLQTPTHILTANVENLDILARYTVYLAMFRRCLKINLILGTLIYMYISGFPFESNANSTETPPSPPSYEVNFTRLRMSNVQTSGI